MSIQNVFDINVDLKQSTVIKTPIITKNDTVVFNVHVYDDGKVFDISRGTTFSIFSKRPDGQVIGKAGTVAGQNTIQFPLGTSETSVPGVVSATIQIHDKDGRVSTFPFCYQVLDDPSIGYVASSTEVTLLQSLINSTQDVIDSANAAATRANEAASSANVAATNANNAAMNANTKASYAQQQGDYAKTQGNYAKTQGDYAKTQGDYAKEQGDVANAAATSATNAANSANTAASNANEAATNATNAANSANNAAAAATNAASSANEAAKNATNAANNANTSADNANNAATAANAAAANAQSVADNTKYIEEYNPNTQYQKNNIVTYNGSSFIAKTATLGHTPVGDSSDPYWALLAEKGVDGKGSVSTVNNVYPDNNGNVELTPADIGAETPLNAQKKADQAEQNAKAYFDSQKGSANGVASLDGSAKVPTSQLPSASTAQAGIVQLDDTLTSTSTTQAATANAVKQVNDAVVAHLADTTKHVTQAEKDTWNSAEQNAKNFVLQANPNLLKNSSFQFGLAGWISDALNDFSVQQTFSLGTYCTHYGPVTAGTWKILESQQRIPVYGGGFPVTLSAWFYTRGITQGDIYLELYRDGTPFGRLYADLNNGWHRKTATFNIPSGTTEIWVKFICGNGCQAGDKAVTRIKLEYGTQATPYSEEANFLYVSDGKAQLKSAITAKGGTVTQAGAVPTFAELVSGVNSIPTGKKWASGTFTSSGIFTSEKTYTVSGLAFKPSIVLVYVNIINAKSWMISLIQSVTPSYYVSRGRTTHAVSNIAVYQIDATYDPRLGYDFSDSSRNKINNDGFTVYLYGDESINRYNNYNWIAIE